MEQIVLDKADMVVAGAGELECFEFTAMFDCMGALSTKYNDTPEKASRAFDKDSKSPRLFLKYAIVWRNATVWRALRGSR